MSLDCMAGAAMCAAWIVLGYTIFEELVLSLVMLAMDVADALAPLAKGAR